MKDELILMDMLNQQRIPSNVETLNNLNTINRYCQCLFKEGIKETGEFDFDFIKTIICESVMYGYFLGAIETKQKARTKNK